MLTPNSIFHSRYLLIDRIGSGGYSQVWLAADQMVGDLQIALKIYAPGQGLDDRAIQIFREEYKIVFYLNHRGLLKPTYFDIFETKPYLVLPFCSGGSLMDMAGLKDEKRIAKMLHQIAGALEYLHNQEPPILHRDIKPENILIDDRDNYYLTDFGISSKLRRTLTKSIGRNKESAGTTAFMAPEIFLAKREYLPASDIFALGIMLYELITEELPFGQLGGVMLNNGAEQPDMQGQCSPGLAKLILSCMDKNPLKRPTAQKIAQTAKAFIENGQWEPDSNNNLPRITIAIPNPQPEPDPKEYPSIKIGDQIWMSENLNVSRFRNGDVIPEARTKKEWLEAGDNKKPAWCYYDNDPENGKHFGKLYNWYAVSDERILAPAGWEIPSNEDWNTLEYFVSKQHKPGIALKATTGWLSNDSLLALLWKEYRNGNGKDIYNFNATPSGLRNGYSCAFLELGYCSFYWSTSESRFQSDYSYYRFLHNESFKLDEGNQLKSFGFSVRCIKKPSQFKLIQ